MFDRIVVVDWSANSSPKLGRDSIWIGVSAGEGEISVANLPTRAAADAFLVELFESETTPTTLLGVDFSLGYPVGTAAALGLAGPPWSATWELLVECIRDDDRNVNNRFEVAAALNHRLADARSPFWGCPPSAASEHLRPSKPASSGSLAEYRGVEQILRGQGYRPFSSWQLLGAGAVGSQSLLGIARLERLRRRFPDRVEVWPFTTSLGVPTLDRGAIVIAEVWPSMLRIDDTSDSVRDAAQVRAAVRWLSQTDASGGLDRYFAPDLPGGLRAAAVDEEGWILGVAP